jgi:formylglycine-generating enzyme required for sulfatase activity
MTRPLKVFLSHAHADADAVRTLYDRLVADGVDAWLDKEKLIPGQDWEREIRKAVREADVVIVCLSKQFNQRGYRQKEVRIALDEAEMMPEGEIFIIPARLEECENLESLRKWHWVDLFEKDGYKQLLRSLQFRAKKVDAELESKRNSITGVFRKPIVIRQKNVEKAEPYNSVPKKDLSLFERFKKLLKEEIQKWVVGILILVFAFFVSFTVPSWFSKVKSFFQATPSSSKTAHPENTPTKTLTPSSALLPEEISDIDPAGNEIPMRLVSEGEFTMGSEGYGEAPMHKIYLDAYYLDQHEITNILYKACVDARWCSKPKNTKYFDNDSYAIHPVVYVDWYQAKSYCEWRDTVLPSEAQWEKAARSIDERTYPWGEDIDCSRANYDHCIGGTNSVGQYENGKSPYSIYDLAGNVWEWVDDWYDAYPGNTIAHSNYGTFFKVLRGGSWDSSVYDVRLSARNEYIPGGYLYDAGFRCAKDAP